MQAALAPSRVFSRASSRVQVRCACCREAFAIGTCTSQLPVSVPSRQKLGQQGMRLLSWGRRTPTDPVAGRQNLC
jgi:hypothetical protein